MQTLEVKAVNRIRQELLGEKGVFCDRSKEEKDGTTGFEPPASAVIVLRPADGATPKKSS
jgi:hypothetical protein